MTARTKALLLILLVMAVSLGVLYGQAAKKPAILFPKGYRHWTHVKTMVIVSNQHPLFEKYYGLHNVYVNDLGWPALQQGKVYPDGSMLAFELFDIRTFQGAIEIRGGRKLLAVMKKNAKLYPETGGWGFEVFQGYQGTGSLKDAKPCFDCHASQKRKDYVQSDYVE